MPGAHPSFFPPTGERHVRLYRPPDHEAQHRSDHPRHGNRDGTDGHYSGQEAGSFDSPPSDRVDAGSLSGGAAGQAGTGPDAGQDAVNLPPDAGHRATIDQRTGAVHGNGAGAGGKQAGEDFDNDTGGANAPRSPCPTRRVRGRDGGAV